MSCKRGERKTCLQLHFVWTINDAAGVEIFSISTKANWNSTKSEKKIHWIYRLWSSFFDSFLVCIVHLPYASKTSIKCRIYWIWWAYVRAGAMVHSPCSTVWELKIRFACADNNRNNFSNKISKVHKICFYFWCDGVSLLLPFVTKIFTFFFYVRISFNRKVFGVDTNFHLRCFFFRFAVHSHFLQFPRQI